MSTNEHLLTFPHIKHEILHGELSNKVGQHKTPVLVKLTSQTDMTLTCGLGTAEGSLSSGHSLTVSGHPDCPPCPAGTV